MPKATSVSPGRSASRSRKSPGAQAASTERNAAKVVESAQREATRIRAETAADAKRLHAEAEEHARRLVLDARATADGVRAEGMEVVSNLRQISDTLHELAERVLEDVEAIHARMIGELDQVAAGGAAPAADPPAEGGEELDVPDFVARS